MKLASWLYDAAREEFGIPASLLRLLDSQGYPRPKLEPPRRSIAASSVVPWHEWGSEPGCLRGELRGWEFSTGTLCSTHQVREDLAHFASCQVVENWTCDIQQIDGISASKSDLQRFTSLDEMVETNAREMIEPLTLEKIQANLAHGEIRILQGRSSDYFIRHQWDGRVFLINSGGSHHFAAARYIAKRLGVPVPLRGKLRTYSIHLNAVASLRRDFEMFVVSDAAVPGLALDDAIRSVKAAYFWHPLPRPPYSGLRAILLPRADWRARRVAKVMHEAGYFDLGAYLRALVANAPT